MAAETTRLPPVVASSSLKAENSKPKRNQNGAASNSEATAYLAGFRLGSLQKEPRPGEIFRRPHTTSEDTPRPLGLIPDRGEKLDILKRLSEMLSPVLPLSAPVKSRARRKKAKLAEKSDGKTDKAILNDRSQSAQVFVKECVTDSQKSLQDESVSPFAKRAKSEQTSRDRVLPDHHLVPFRLPESIAEKEEEKLPNVTKESPGSRMKAIDREDSEYVDTLAKCNIREYLPSSRLLSHQEAANSPRLGLTQLSPDRSRRSGKLGRVHSRSSSVEYVSFTGQVQLWSREQLTDDRRDALGYEPCERCRVRGGRCPKCKAIRTGGGYIILDGSELSELEKIQRFGRRFTLGQPTRYGAGMEGKQRHRRHRSDQDSGGERSGVGFDINGPEEAERGRSLVSGGKRREGGGSEWGGLETGFGEGGAAGKVSDGRERLHDYTQDGREQNMGYGDQSGRRSQEDGRNRLGSAMQSRHGGDGRERSGRDEGNGLDHDSGRQSSTSQRTMSASRPGSTLGSRPGSSMRRVGRNWERKDRQKRSTDLTFQDGQGRFKGRRDGSGSDSGDDDGKARQRRRRKGGEDGDKHGNKRSSELDGMDNDRAKFQYQRDSDEEEDNTYHGDLMRFKRKRDNVKAIQATLKELQGIHPLDYLAKYCIIDQEKLPHYRRSFDNVDRDEDDEIDIMELDFALKAVNYDLISDAEMNYVHSVLELAGRYRLNFRLFSLIAALSERVATLDDMVKRLINKMDFEALEVKMRKCKALFYLLADAESTHDGGVVTTASLAVELQAGGLTHDHVEFVVDRLNREDKGLVEFLDYLTYVPLFVEIHDSISGNPLDFTRTK